MSCKTLFLRALLLPLVAVLMGGCAEDKSQNKKRDDVILKSYRLIDEQRSDEAIALLESSLENDPDNYDYQIVLASAYAHKGGFKIQKIANLMGITKGFKDLKLEMTTDFHKQEINQRVSNVAWDVSTLLSGFSTVFYFYSQIPVLDASEGTYLNHAIYLLNEVKDPLKPEDALYRAILRVILFKHRLAQNFIGEFVADKEGSENLTEGSEKESTENEARCRFDLGAVNDGLIELGKILIGIFSDLGVANPSQKSDMDELGETVADKVSSLTIATTSLTMIDEISSLFIEQSIIQHDFGKLIKCGGN